MKNIAIFDGNSIINRAFYAIRNMSFNGHPTNALYGFVNTVLKHIERSEQKYDYAAVAFDLPGKTFRHTACESYKATRKGMPEELVVQFPYAKKFVAALGLPVVECEGFEADDILGTLSKIAESFEIRSYLITGDRDSYQLIDDYVNVLYESNNGTVLIDNNKIFELYELIPCQLIDLKAIMGDSSDNIKGVAGIGEKGALELIRKYKSLDCVYENLESIKSSLRQKLEASKDEAYMSRFLAEINRNVPISVNIEDYKILNKNINDLTSLYTQFGFSKMLGELKTVKPIQTEIIEELYGKPVNFNNEAEMFYVYAENDKIHIFDGETAFYINCNELDTIEFANKKIIAWDLKHLLKTFYAKGIKFDFQADDLALMAYIVSQNSGETSPAGVSREFLNSIEITSFVTLMPELEIILINKINDYGCSDLYKNIELPLTYVLAECEHYGFAADKKGLEEYSAALDRNLREIEELIYSLCDEKFNILSPKQLGVILFEKLLLPPGKKTKSGYSTDVEVLEKLCDYHPAVPNILTYRKLSKLKSTYADGLLKVISSDGRIRTTFRQTLTNTGRLSSVEPNLQNIPVRTELGKVLRKFFTAKEGYVLIDADYSQIELRILAHISGDELMIEAFKNGIDIHTRTASQIFHLPESMVTSEQRKRAKAVNFGIIYGIGDFSLSKDIGVSRKEAAVYIEKYLQTYPKAAKYLENVKSSAKTNGYVSTMLGRRRYIPELSLKNKQLVAFGERVAMNAPIQGTAADIIKKAMVDTAYEYKKQNLDARIILQIHDELIVEAKKEIKEKAASILKKSMEDAVLLDVPLTVEIGIGENWFNAKD